MRYRKLKTPHQTLARRLRVETDLERQRAVGDAGGSDAGPRPVSARQQAFRENRVTGADIIDRVAPRRAKPATQPHVRRKPVSRRDANTTRVLRTRPKINRRRVNLPVVLLRAATVFLVVEAIAALLFSPRLWVRKTTVEGNSTVPTARLLDRLHIGPHDNIVRLPVGRLRRAILEAEPAIETVDIHRSLPGTVRLVVQERLPWASACLPNGSCYTIDKNLVPFRQGPEPDPALPKLNLSGVTSAGTMPVAGVVLGKPLRAPGLDTVSRCLAWSAAHRFPLASVQIAPDGKLCLNRTGDVQVQLGTEVDLEKKLQALSVLLLRKPELRDTADVAYINLFAYEAPAICPRSVAPLTPEQQASRAAAASATASPAGQANPQVGTPE